jgi:hypothetical protein
MNAMHAWAPWLLTASASNCSLDVRLSLLLCLSTAGAWNMDMSPVARHRCLGCVRRLGATRWEEMGT